MIPPSIDYCYYHVFNNNTFDFKMKHDFMVLKRKNPSAFFMHQHVDFCIKINILQIIFF